MKGLNDKYTRVIGVSEQAELARTFDTVPLVLRQNAGSLYVAHSEVSGTRSHEETGLRAGDEILSIDGTTTAGMSIYTAADMLESLPGPIRLEFTRGASGAPNALMLASSPDRRGNGAVVDVEYQLKRMRDRKVGYIRISKFSAGVSTLVSEAVASTPQVGEGAADVWVLDLRGNSGGLVREAQRIAGAFLGDGGVLVRVLTHRQVGHGVVFSQLPSLLPKGWVEGARGHRNVVGTDKGVIVLVDEGSASASEFLAVALEEGRGATVAGKQSRGKALIQGLFPLEQPENAVIVTTGLVAAPSSRCSWQGSGLRPRVKLEMLPPAPLPLPLSLPALSQLIERVAAEALTPQPPPDAASDDSAKRESACAGLQGGGSLAGRWGPLASETEGAETMVEGAFRCPTYWACGWDAGR